MGENDAENEAHTYRYYGIAATYDNGGLSGYLAVDSTNYASNDNVGGYWDTDDSLTVTFGGSYDFEVVKVYLGAQWYQNTLISKIGGVVANNSFYGPEGALELGDVSLNGYSILLGRDAPLGGGKLMAAAAYKDGSEGDVEEDEYDFTRWVVSVGYDYPLSKRTNVYGVMSYMDDQLEGKKGDFANQEWNLSAYTFMVGMRHKF